jgi:hypothetical protein
MIQRLQDLLGHPRAGMWLALLAVVLVLPSLWGGVVCDDHFIRVVSTEDPALQEVQNHPLDTFSFTGRTEEDLERLLERGGLPWWSPEDLSLSFWRPLTAATHWVDFNLLGKWPAVMHLHSILWYAALALLVAALYRRMMMPAWVAGLATLLYVVNDAHIMPVGWLANRNALTTAVFGVLTVLMHDRWRREGSRGAAVLSVVFFTIGLFCGEAGAAAGGILFAYAVTLDRASWPRRIASLIPCGAVGIAWQLLYRSLGYGIVGSGLYMDPGQAPGLFLEKLFQHLPVLLASYLTLPDSTLWAFEPPAWQAVHVVFAVTMLVLLTWVLWPLLRRDAKTRFWLVAMIVSVLPACSAWPQDRLMVLPGIGAMALVAQIIAAWRENPAWVSETGRAKAVKILAVLWVAIHLVISPVILVNGCLSVGKPQRFLSALSNSLPTSPTLAEEDVVIICAPADLVAASLPLVRASEGKTVARTAKTLYAGLDSVDIFRIDDRTLVLTVTEGFVRYPLNMIFCRIETHPMAPGDVIETKGMRVEVLSVSPEGNPLEVKFSFDGPLEEAIDHWLTWTPTGYVPFELPPVGESTQLPGMTLLGFVLSLMGA